MRSRFSRFGQLGLGVLAGVSTLAACGLALALMGLGVPVLVAAVLAAAAVGVVVHAASRWQSAARPNPDAARCAELEREMSRLRHELRGALSPALMITDRLLRNEDPAVQRAGQTVIASVNRAVGLLAPEK